MMIRSLSWALAIAVAMTPDVVLAEAGSFTKEVLPILNSQCVMCHIPGAELGGLTLYPDAWLSLVGIASIESALKRVEPGEPDKSYMYLKLMGLQDSVGGTGLRMPPTQQLEPAQLETIRQWIEQGAKRD
jgi:mono/diheme cytochrome c family protein